MVVLHPHERLRRVGGSIFLDRPREREHLVGERLVRRLVPAPLLLRHLRLPLEHRERDVVEERPQHVVAEAVVEELGRRLVEEDGDALERHVLGLAQLGAHRLLLLRRHRHPRPPHPRDVHVAHAEEGGDEAARRALERPARALLRAAHGDRQPVRHDDHARPLLVARLRRLRLLGALLVELALQLLDLREEVPLVVLLPAVAGHAPRLRRRLGRRRGGRHRVRRGPGYSNCERRPSTSAASAVQSAMTESDFLRRVARNRDSY